MELRHLRYFVAVAEEQNVSRAALRLRVSQPPLSRQIRDLEHDLGVALFVRSPKSLRLTDEGKLFLQEARAVLQRADEAVEAVRRQAAGTSGELHLGYAPSPTVEVLPPALAAFQKAMPKVRVTLRDLSTEDMLRQLREHRLHLALNVRAGTVSMRGITFTLLRRYGLHVAMNSAHPLVAARRITAAQLVDERLVGYTRADYPEYHAGLERLFAPTKKRRPLLVEEYDSGTSLLAAVEAGRGLALVTSSFACFAGLRVILRPMTPATTSAEVGVAHLPETLSPAAVRFVEILREQNLDSRGRPKPTQIPRL